MNLETYGGRRFLMTMGCGMSCTVLVWYAKISDAIFRDIIIATGNDGQYQKLCEAIGAVDLAADPARAKLSTALKEWWTLPDFAAFQREVKKALKADIPLKQRNEWEDEINTTRAEINTLTAEIARDGAIGVLFTEHDMDAVFAHADRILVLVRGEIVAEGTPEEVRANAEVKRVYLGDTGHRAALRARRMHG